MNPITREEMYLASAAGEYSGELPEPKTRLEYYLKKIKEAVENGSSVAPEDIDAAIEAYLNSHDADIVTEKELSDALAGYYDKDAVDTALNEKQDTLTAGDNISIETVNGELKISATDTTYSDATQQTHGLMSTADKTKLDGITAAKMQAWDAAEQNVNADWTAESGDAQILHKPDLSVYALATNVTKSALGIDNVDNTSDADKPISTAAETALAGKVDKETNKSLMSADEHTKLTGIEAGAQVNTVTGVKGNAENNYRTGEINISPANIGLGNVDNTSDANKPISTATQTALDGKQNVLTFDNSPTENSDNPVKSGGVYSALAGKISISAKGANGGVAELDANGKIPSSQMPSSVDNILEYPTLNDFPATGEDRKIYIALDTKLTYRWGGTEYGEISPSIALGTTSSTAYRGDWGAEDRAAIGTLTDLQTTAKSDLVSAVNELKTALGGVQGTLTFDNVPTENSNNPVKSGGIYTALAGKQDTLTIDSAPTSGSDNPVKSGGVYTALSGKQNTLTFDSTPTENSTNPVTSGGIYNALAGKQNSLTIDGSPAENSTNPVTSGGVYTALAGKADATATQTALNAKQDALTAGDNVSIATVNGVPTISATDTTYPYKTNMIFDENYKTQFRSQTKGNAYAGGYISNIKVSSAGVDSAPQYGAGLAFGTSDTHGYINMNYSGDGFYVGGGSADKLNWTSRVYTTNYKPTKSDVGLGNVANLDQSSAIKNITRSGTTFTATRLDGTTFTFTQQDNNTTYSNATSSAAGLMSAADKEKLDGINIAVVTQAQYDAIASPDSGTLYLIPEASA